MTGLSSQLAMLIASQNFWPLQAEKAGVQLVEPSLRKAAWDYQKELPENEKFEIVTI